MIYSADKRSNWIFTPLRWVLLLPHPLTTDKCAIFRGSYFHGVRTDFWSISIIPAIRYLSTISLGSCLVITSIYLWTLKRIQSIEIIYSDWATGLIELWIIIISVPFLTQSRGSRIPSHVALRWTWSWIILPAEIAWLDGTLEYSGMPKESADPVIVVNGTNQQWWTEVSPKICLRHPHPY